MNEFVWSPGELMRNSLILTGLTLRTFSIAVSDCFRPLVGVHEALPTKSPLKAVGPEVTLKVALTLAPAATGPGVLAPPEANAVQPLGTEMLNSTPVAGAPVVFVNVTVTFCEEPGTNVWSPGGAAVADAGARVSRGTSYLAATTLTCTSWSVAFVGKAPAA